MKKNETTITRRDFMKGTALLSLGAVAGFPLPGETKKTKVILIRNEHVLNPESQTDAKIIQQMLDEAMVNLFDTKDTLSAWKNIFKPDDIVGIKTNVWRYLPTPPELEQAIKQRLLDVGVAEKNIGIDDRGIRNNPVFQNATALINTRPARIHYWAGVGSLIKNYIMFASSPSSYHDDACADLAKVWLLPHVKDRTRLNILSVVRVHFHGKGPQGFDKRYIFDYKGLIVGTDPVAVDTVGLKIIQAKRMEYFGEMRNLETTPHHIVYADSRHHLGTSDINKIELVKLGWQEGILI